MATPFRDEAAADREELLSLEQEHRELADRIAGLRRDLSRHPDTELARATKIGCVIGVAWVPVLVVLLGFGLSHEFGLWNAAKNRAAWLTAQRIAAVATDAHCPNCWTTPSCPSVDYLVGWESLDPKLKDDPWGYPYEVVCEGDDKVWVYSIGKDGIAHTADDIASDMPRSNLEPLEKLSR